MQPKAPGEASGGICAAQSQRFAEEKPGTEKSSLISTGAAYTCQ